MPRKTVIMTICLTLFILLPVTIQAAPTSKLGRNLAELEREQKKKQKQLERLKAYAKDVENEIGRAKYDLAKVAGSSVAAPRADAQGFVTRNSAGIIHSPTEAGRSYWHPDFDQIRKQFEDSGIYTQDEINSRMNHLKSYVTNLGFTAPISEVMDRLIDSEARHRKLEKMIQEKEQEIQDIENAMHGTVGGGGGGGGGGGAGGGGGGGGGY